MMIVLLKLLHREASFVTWQLKFLSDGKVLRLQLQRSYYTGPLVRNLNSYGTRMMRIKLSRATNSYLHAAYYFRQSVECWTPEV